MPDFLQRIASWVSGRGAAALDVTPAPSPEPVLRQAEERRERLTAVQQAAQRPVTGMHSRMYHGARTSRLTAGMSSSPTSADAELYSSLAALRARSRQLVRDAGYAKRARNIVMNNVIGSGVGMQAGVKNQRGRLLKKVNDSIEATFRTWSRAEFLHTGGKLSLAQFERACLAQIFETGEILIRRHMRSFGGSRVPYALELIESERLPHDYTSHYVEGANRVRLGVEVDEFDRPVAYWLRQRHPGDVYPAYALGTERLERIPASEIWHLYVIDRWPQSRGEPWLHAVARKLNDMDGYSEAEIIAARASAAYMGFIKKNGAGGSMVDEKDEETGEQITELSAGVIQELEEGEDFVPFAPNRPNAALDPFMRAMLREVAAGIGVSYESLSRDYSQSNYSSSRLALLDDRDLWRVLQAWWVESFRWPLHREWLRQAMYSGAIPGVQLEEYILDPLKFEACKFKPRGWNWVDPTKEVQAYKEAVRCGFTTLTDVIAQTGNGMDIEDVLDTRKAELELAAEMGLKFDTDPGAQQAAPAAPPSSSSGGSEDDDAEDPPDAPAARIVSLRKT